MKTVTLFSWEHCRHLPLRHSTVGTHLLSLTPNKGPKLFPVTESLSLCSRGSCLAFLPAPTLALGSTQAPFVPLMSLKCLAWVPASPAPTGGRGGREWDRAHAGSAMLGPGRTGIEAA